MPRRKPALPPHLVAFYDRMRAWHGLTPTTGHACPRRVAGKRCRLAQAEDAPLILDCLCTCYPSLADHAHAWRTAEGQLVVTWEPYSTADLTMLRPFARELASIGLSLTIDARRSPWNPGYTVLLTVRREVPA